MPRVTLFYGEKQYELEVDEENGLETFFFQVFSVTNVEPESLRLFGLGADPLTLATAGSVPFTLTDGQAVALLEPEPTLTGMGSEDGVGILASSYAQAWQSSCTAEFFGEDSIHQPCLSAATSPDKPQAFVCFACATTCFLPSQVSVVRASGLLSQTGFSCGCRIAKLSTGGCLFAPRFGSQLLTGPARAVMLTTLNGAFTDQQARAALQEKSKKYAAQQPQLQAMQARIQSAARNVMLYQDSANQAEALRVIPVAELCKRAAANQQPKPTPRLELLFQLLSWFRKDFFKWINAPVCGSCGSATTAVGRTEPTAEEMLGMAHVVEVYRCTTATCGAMTRFPRYNNPKTLLSWRQGRCGEWTNCFTLCCIAMGYDARHCTDWTDHVWTEVWSTHHKRWLHLDPAETAFDTPLLYEAGWGKKLNYIIACNKDEVVDVTRRYTKKYDEVLSRRNQVPEDWLADLISLLDCLQKHQVGKASASRLAELAQRSAFETRELEANIRLDTGERKPEELQGRISGSLSWRLLRGELGTLTSSGAAAADAAPGSGSSLPSSTFPGLLFGWDVVGVTSGVSASIMNLASFGEQLIALHSDGSLIWCQVSALLSQVAGTSPASPSAWKKLSVWDEAGVTWPAPDAPLVALAAQTGTMRLLACTSAGSLFIMVAGPKPATDPALRGAAPSAQSEKKASRAVRVGVVPPQTSGLVVFKSALFAVVTDPSSGGRSLQQWSVSVDDAASTAAAVLASASASAPPPSSWMPVCTLLEGARVIASGSALLSIGSFGVDILVKVVTGATSFDEYPPGAGILFSVSQYLSVGSSFPVRITRHLVSKSGTGDWVGLVRVGQPSEMVGSFLLDVDALPSTSFDKDGNLAFQWPSDCTPRSPGLYELRYFSGPGFSKLRAVSGPVVVVPDLSPGLRWVSLASVQNIDMIAPTPTLLVAVSASKELCTSTLPRSVSLLPAPIDTQKALAERAVGPPAAGGTAPSPPKPPSTAEALMKRLFTQLVRGCGVAGCDNPQCATAVGRPLTANEAAATALKLLSSNSARFCTSA